jgi:hypothetical protein
MQEIYTTQRGDEFEIVRKDDCEWCKVPIAHDTMRGSVMCQECFEIAMLHIKAETDSRVEKKMVDYIYREAKALRPASREPVGFAYVPTRIEIEMEKRFGRVCRKAIDDLKEEECRS